MKEGLVRIEDFSIIFNKVYELKFIHLILVMEKYQSGNQRLFLIIQMILI